MKVYISILLFFYSFTTFAQAPEKTFTKKLEGIQTSTKELTKSASTDNSSVGQGGVMTTSVPLVTVKSRTMEFPLQLNYSAGIKTDQTSGPVGLGWVLPVGSITRDYGAFQPDYTSTSHEGSPASHKLNHSTPLNAINPGTHNRQLNYDRGSASMPLSDFYNVSIPGMGSNTFWNGGSIGGNHAWKWNEATGWKVSHSAKTYIIDQEYSRINEMNIGLPYFDNKNQFDNSGSYAVAIGMLPYVNNSYVGKYNEPNSLTSKVHYEDFKEFIVVDESGTMYVFGRALRGQKYIFQEDPYWSTTDNPLYYAPENGGPAESPKGSYWKTDFIAEWLLTEIRSADYQDLNGNGIADDGDAGDWIRFEYTEPTQQVQTVPLGSGNSFTSTVPKHREWSSFSQTDQASSLMRELAYLTKIVTPAQELVFTISQRYDLEHDYYAKPANKIGLNFYYEDRKASTTYGTEADFDIHYPIETMRYDEIEVYSRLMDKLVYPSENLRTGRIKLNYAEKGSSQELAVSEFLIRTNNDLPKITLNGKHLGAPSNSGFSISDYNNGRDKRGKTTLLSVDFYGGDVLETTKTSYKFEYGYNPSFNEIHKREIIRKWSSPSLRSSVFANSAPGENIKGYINIPYTEQVIGSNGTSYSTVNYTGSNEIMTHDFLIDIPYSEKYYRQVFPSTDALKTYEQYNSSFIQYPVQSDEILHRLKPIKDVYGYLYGESCIKCPEAWSLTKITYPTGGQVSFEYEISIFELEEDKPNWSFDAQSVPLISEYNELARHRSIVQDSYIQFEIYKGRPGIGANNRRKTLTATFEVDMPNYYGIRLKSKTTYDRINPPIVMNYVYGYGHFTSCPAEYLQNVIGNFNSFIFRELNRSDWELDDYGNTSGVWSTDFREKMKYPAISELSLDGYQSTHFYESIDVKSVDNSYIRNHYGSIIGTTIPYVDYNLFCYKMRRAGYDGAYILGGNNITLSPIGLKKTEFFDASSPTIPYKTITNTYERISLLNYPFTVDYRGGLAVDNEMTIWDNSFEVWLVAPIAMQPGQYGFGYHPSAFVSKSLTLPYKGVQSFSYPRWGSYRTSLKKVENNYKGMITTTEYTYNQYNQLKQESVNGVHTTEKYITTYEYAYETYASSTTSFLTKNMLNAPTRTTTYLDQVVTSKAISSQMQTYDYTSFSIPRPLHSYAYETSTLNANGTFTLVPFNITSSSNINWRKQEAENSIYNKQGMPVASKTNRLYGKAVYGNNLVTPKAHFMFPNYVFDATYTGFEDLNQTKLLTTDWTPESYLNETWFATSSTNVEEPAYSINIPSNPCNLYVPSNISTQAYPTTKYLNVVTVDNINNLQVGDAIKIELTGNSNSIPVNYTATFETTISAILNTNTYYPSPTPAVAALIKDYIVCFSDPIVYPGSSVMGPVGYLDENAFTTISQTKVTKKIVNHFKLSKIYKRTGNYSCQLGTKRAPEQAFTRTPVRPVKTSANFNIDCNTIPGGSTGRGTLPDYCYNDYEASMWISYSPDSPTFPGSVTVTPKSGDAAGDARYRRGTVSSTDNGGKIKIVCDVYNTARTVVEEQHIFYPNAVDHEWQQYTIDLEINNQQIKWIDVYVVNEIEQLYVSVRNAKSVFVDDVLVYPKGAKYAYNTYGKFGSVTYTSDNNDVFAKTEFDEKGRPVSEMNAYGSIVKEYGYFDTPTWPSQNNHVTELTRVNTSLYHQTRYYLDGFGKTKQVTTSDPGKGLRIFSETVEYNTKGNIIRSYKPYAVKNATLSHHFDGNYALKTNELYATYSAFSDVTYESKPEQVIKSVSAPKTNAESAIVSNQSDFLNTSIIQNTSIGHNFAVNQLLVHELIDANGNPVRTYMDNLGRVIMEEQKIGKTHIQNANGSISINASSVEEVARTWFVYDKAGRITDTYDPQGKRSQYKYNSLGLLISSDVPDEGKTEMRYDLYGQVRFTRNQKDIQAGTDSGGKPQFKYFKYDVWGRVTESGMMIANASCTACPTADWFNDVSRLNDQQFPSTGTRQMQIYQQNKYDGQRDHFDSDALLKETMFSKHIPMVGNTFAASSSDETNYGYMADGQLAQKGYIYNGLPGEHIVKQQYNTFRVPTGKQYIHPTNTQYNFSWSTEIDHFGRATYFETVHNAVPQQSGRNYFDLLGNLLYSGIGKKNTPGDPHLDYVVYRMNIRDQITDMRSKTLRIGLTYDKIGNITTQHWSNEHFDPSATNPVPVNIYDYYYDGMRRLTGADYKTGTYTTNPFGNLATLTANRPVDFSCGLNPIMIGQALSGHYNRMDSLAGLGISGALEAKNVLGNLESTYLSNNVPYNYLSEIQKSLFLNGYLNGVKTLGMNPAAFELYEAERNNDAAHKTAILNTPVFTSNLFKYTKLLLTTLPFEESSDCQTSQGAVVYGFLPTMPTPASTSNVNKYDAAYWYQKNGNITKLNRNDQSGIKTEQNYAYSSSLNNRLSSLTRIVQGITLPQTAYTYDLTGNLLTDPRNGVTNITYDTYSDLPQSIANAGGTKRYRYNAQGIRLFKENSATPADRYYYIDDVVLDGLGVVKSYQTATGYAVPYTSGTTIVVDYFYYLKDWLGTVRGVLDASGTALNANDHYPYGLRMPGRSFVTDAEGERYQFTGHEFDAETTYDYHGARYYNRELGRYMSVDPLAMKFPGWSTYNYVMGNPISLIDPTGMGPDEPEEEDKQKGTWQNSSGITYNYDEETSLWINPSNEATITRDASLYRLMERVQSMERSRKEFEQYRTQQIASIYADNVPPPTEQGRIYMPTERAADGRYYGGCMSCHSPAGAYYDDMDRLGWHEYAKQTFGLGLSVAPGSSSVMNMIGRGFTNATKTSTTALTKFYPANNGFLGAAERTFLMPGQQISRFGSNSGKFFSPAGTPLPMRALPPGANTSIHNTFKVLKPFEVQAGKIAPAFGQPGLGTQYLSPVSVDVLLKRGIIGY